MEFQKEALFKQLVSNSGMNLYLGAGFSTYAYNSDRESLPLGDDINKRLIDIFSLDKTRQFNLSKSWQKIKKDNKEALNRLVYARNVIRYCDRFGIDEYSNKYIISSISQIEEILQRNEYMYIKIKKELKGLLIQLKEKKNSVTIT